MEEKVLVVGGGIGGLVLARALARRGVAVDVVERAPALRAVGAGITLGANAMRALGSVGLGEAVAARGLAMRAGAVAARDGRPLSTTRFDSLAPRYGEAYAIHRGALHEALAEGLPGEVQVRCDTTVTALTDGGAEGVEVQLSTGASVRYRAVVGADGLRSMVRTLAFGPNEPLYAGYTCWRWTGRVEGVAASMVEQWGRGEVLVEEDPTAPHEAHHLRLDSSKAAAELGWQAQLTPAERVAWTVDWYMAWQTGPSRGWQVAAEQIEQYERRVV
jgi:2-polyprenyl-6-methoxyphenol hydroxylase-like FAD-dependent oxidoreductase